MVVFLTVFKRVYNENAMDIFFENILKRIISSEIHLSDSYILINCLRSVILTGPA